MNTKLEWRNTMNQAGERRKKKINKTADTGNQHLHCSLFLTFTCPLNQENNKTKSNFKLQRRWWVGGIGQRYSLSYGGVIIMSNGLMGHSGGNYAALSIMLVTAGMQDMPSRSGCTNKEKNCGNITDGWRTDDLASFDTGRECKENIEMGSSETTEDLKNLTVKAVLNSYGRSSSLSMKIKPIMMKNAFVDSLHLLMLLQTWLKPSVIKPLQLGVIIIISRWIWKNQVELY